jgi:hypothetical protein
VEEPVRLEPHHEPAIGLEPGELDAGPEPDIVEVEWYGLKSRSRERNAAAGPAVRDHVAYGQAKRQCCKGGGAEELSAIDVARHVRLLAWVDFL